MRPEATYVILSRPRYACVTFSTLYQVILSTTLIQAYQKSTRRAVGKGGKSSGELVVYEVSIVSTRPLIFTGKTYFFTYDRTVSPQTIDTSKKKFTARNGLYYTLRHSLGMCS